MRDEQWAPWDDDQNAWRDEDHARQDDDASAAWDRFRTVKIASSPRQTPRPSAYSSRATGQRAAPEPWQTMHGWTAEVTRVRSRPTAPSASASRGAPARLPALIGPVASAPRTVTPRMRAFCDAPTAMRAALPPGVTLIPGSGGRPLLERSRPRGWSISGAAGLVLASIIVLVVFRFSGPADSGPRNLADLAANVAGPAAGGPALATDAALPALGLWQADIVEVPVLGGGGASAPGAQAPGTASAPAAPPAAPGTASAPAQSGSPGTASAPPAPPVAHATPTQAPAPKPPAPAGGGIAAAPVSPWPPQNGGWIPVRGYAPYALSDPPGDIMAAAFGQCTWWSQRTRLDENLRGMGNARYWAGNAALRGYHVGATPAVGATVVFQPGVQGAGWAGHVAHVLALYPDGWFLISEMNSYGNGGGWGRVSYRYAHVGWGVAFIY